MKKLLDPLIIQIILKVTITIILLYNKGIIDYFLVIIKGINFNLVII